MNIDKNMMTLDILPIGKKAYIKNLNTSGKLLYKLLDMGFVNNTQIEIVRKAPLLDPIEIKLHNYHISVRANEAKLIEIELEK